MGYKALITLDLPEVSETKRQSFYEKLEKEKWIKLEGLTTTWKTSFENDVERVGVISTLKNDIKKAKTYSSVLNVNFAIQVGKGKVELS